jgi:hypothetical protein
MREIRTSGSVGRGLRPPYPIEASSDVLWITINAPRTVVGALCRRHHAAAEKTMPASESLIASTVD